MNPVLGAGFYLHTWGPMPFAIGNAGIDEYYAYTILLPNRDVK